MLAARSLLDLAMRLEVEVDEVTLLDEVCGVVRAIQKMGGEQRRGGYLSVSLVVWSMVRRHVDAESKCAQSSYGSGECVWRGGCFLEAMTTKSKDCAQRICVPIRVLVIL